MTTHLIVIGISCVISEQNVWGKETSDTLNIIGNEEISKKNITGNEDTKIIFLEIPQKLNIKDKIFLVNRSQTTILQAVVALVSQDSNIPIGNVGTVMPGNRAEMASYTDNWLKKVKGKTIALKIKGVKKMMGDIKTTGIKGGSFSTGPIGIDIEHRDILAEELNNIDPALITYDYTARVSEENHDLYITVSSGTNVFDF